MQKECAWQAPLLCTEVFKKKKVVWGLNLYILNCISKTASHFFTCFDMNFKTVEAQSIGFFTAEACLL